MNEDRLTVHLFGTFELKVGGEPVRRMRARSVEWLFALLTLRHGREVSRSWLSGLLWMDSTEEQALHNLRRNLMDLRKSLGPEASRILTPSKSTLCLDLNGAFADVAEFDSAIQVGDEESLRRAVELYRGPLLEGCYQEWVYQERESRSEAYARALETLADYAGKRGNQSEALTFLRQAEMQNPLQDSIQRGIMAALSMKGDTAEALLAYREFKARLQTEMGIEPDEETTRLFRAIRERAQKLIAPSPPSILTSKVDPQPVMAATLPRPLTTLIGRDEEIKKIIECLNQARIVTLAGSGGVGKTRLSIQTAEQLASVLAVRVAFVELAQVSYSSRLVYHVASTLGVSETSVRETEQLLQSIAGFFAGRESLLVLDNCEHLIEASAAFTQALLERCPDLRVLATSRQPLGLTGELIWRVPSLPVPEIDNADQNADPIDFVMQFPAVQLFVERAAMARQGFQLMNTEDAIAVTEICSRLDGIPLAIEMAAARMNMLTPKQIAARLQDRFRLLTGGSRAVFSRHQTLRALIDWSYDLLSEGESTLLRWLSVFVGGWSFEAAETICQTLTETGYSSEDEEAVDALETLASLIDKSLVLVEHRDATPRYRMMETVAEYAREKLDESEEMEAALKAHLRYFIHFAEQTEAKTSWVQKFKEFDRELENLLKAHESSGLLKDCAEAGLHLTAAMRNYWSARGLYRLGLRVNSEALEREGAPRLLRERALTLQACSVSSFYLGQNEEAISHMEEALTLFRQLDNPADTALALDKLGILLVHKDKDAALSCFEEAIDLAKKIGEKRVLASALGNLADLERLKGHLDRAASLYNQALPLCREVNHTEMIVVALLNMACVSIEKGEYHLAKKQLAEAVKIAHDAKLKRREQSVLEVSAVLAAAMEEGHRAAHIWGASEAERERMGLHRELVDEQFLQRFISKARGLIGEDAFRDESRKGSELPIEDALLRTRLWLEEGQLSQFINRNPVGL